MIRLTSFAMPFRIRVLLKAGALKRADNKIGTSLSGICESRDKTIFAGSSVMELANFSQSDSSCCLKFIGNTAIR